MEILSIVVPCYNEQEVLPLFYEETTKVLKNMDVDYEIIYVDDGSKDDSGRICDKYAEKDKRIKVIHKENEGLSEARNLGIKLSKGEHKNGKENWN